MKTDNKKLKFSKAVFGGAFIYNPVLTQAIGVCTIVAIGTTLRTSLAFSVILSALLIFIEVLTSLLLKKVARWLRIALYMMISSLIILPVTLWMDKNMSELSAAMGIFLPLLAANSIIVIRSEIFAVNNNVRNSLFDAVAAGIGFTVVSVITGTFREILAYGTVWGKTVSKLPALKGIALPFGGLLLIGFLAALHKWVIMKRYPRYPTNTFNLRTAFDKPTFRNEGINATDGSLTLRSTPKGEEETSSSRPKGNYVAVNRSKLVFEADDEEDDVFPSQSESTPEDKQKEGEEE